MPFCKLERGREQARLAKELHDGLGHLLVKGKMSVDSLESEDENIQHSSQLLHNPIDELRHISHDLMPVTFIRLGLIPTLRDLKRQIEKVSSIECDWQLIDEIDTDDEQKHAIYRSARRHKKIQVSTSIWHVPISPFKISMPRLWPSKTGNALTQNAIKKRLTNS